MINDIKISIVLSSYNGDKYIYDQLESLRLQTRQPDEVIIGDDCSSDSTCSIIESYIKRNKLERWIFIKNKINKGWRRNFVELINKAKGDLIFPCDQDDVWEKNKLLIMSDIMINNPNINLLVSYVTEFFTNEQKRIYPLRQINHLKKIPLTKRFMNVRFPGCAYCIRSDFAQICNYYWTDKIPHDALYWRMAMFDESLYKIGIPLIKQRKHSDSAFAIEAQKSHSLKKKLSEIEYTSQVIDGINYMLEDRGRKSLRKEKILYSAKRWNLLREKLYKSKNPFYLIFLLFYLSYYQTVKRYFLDVFLVFFYK